MNSDIKSNGILAPPIPNPAMARKVIKVATSGEAPDTNPKIEIKSAEAKKLCLLPTRSANTPKKKLPSVIPRNTIPAMDAI